MFTINKNEGARNTLHMKKTTGCVQCNMTLIRLQEIRQTVVNQLVKMRFTPIWIHTHEDYLNFLNHLLEECVL